MLQDIVKAKGMTIPELCERAKIAPATLYQKQKIMDTLSYRKLREIGDALDMSVEELLDECGRPSRIMESLPMKKVVIHYDPIGEKWLLDWTEMDEDHHESYDDIKQASARLKELEGRIHDLNRSGISRDLHVMQDEKSPDWNRVLGIYVDWLAQDSDIARTIADFVRTSDSRQCHEILELLGREVNETEEGK